MAVTDPTSSTIIEEGKEPPIRVYKDVLTFNHARCTSSEAKARLSAFKSKHDIGIACFQNFPSGDGGVSEMELMRNVFPDSEYDYISSLNDAGEKVLTVINKFKYNGYVVMEQDNTHQVIALPGQGVIHNYSGEKKDISHLVSEAVPVLEISDTSIHDPNQIPTHMANTGPIPDSKSSDDIKLTHLKKIIEQFVNKGNAVMIPLATDEVTAKIILDDTVDLSTLTGADNKLIQQLQEWINENNYQELVEITPFPETGTIFSDKIKWQDNLHRGHKSHYAVYSIDNDTRLQEELSSLDSTHFHIQPLKRTFDREQYQRLRETFSSQQEITEPGPTHSSTPTRMSSTERSEKIAEIEKHLRGEDTLLEVIDLSKAKLESGRDGVNVYAMSIMSRYYNIENNKKTGADKKNISYTQCLGYGPQYSPHMAKDLVPFIIAEMKKNKTRPLRIVMPLALPAHMTSLIIDVKDDNTIDALFCNSKGGDSCCGMFPGHPYLFF
ncbi:MAG: hypothetical protein HOI53_09215 [Francisellaceae bacterium]|jgi:hypothetical protein|nr:hypothetical protein [Francisellaceae bacterium]MBT6208192.1 hypothetical protein [Francisellaceae bacterium]MBT6539300.1 hypothetical protein [Francisellaceae bacterium]